jgi:hypothetical protein
MKHAGAERIERAAALLAPVRALPGIKEKSPGSFYRSGAALLHFHEDGEALWADVKQSGEWVRMPANNKKDMAAIVRLLT